MEHMLERLRLDVMLYLNRHMLIAWIGIPDKFKVLCIRLIPSYLSVCSRFRVIPRCGHRQGATQARGVVQRWWRYTSHCSMLHEHLFPH
jgi:hypothetical protein